MSLTPGSEEVLISPSPIVAFPQTSIQQRPTAYVAPPWSKRKKVLVMLSLTLALWAAIIGVALNGL